MNERRMTTKEATVLCRFAKAAFPHMAVDEFTPDAWAEILAPLRIEDCKEAIVNLARRDEFLSTSAIWGEVKRIRNNRVLACELPDPPPGLTDADYGAWLMETRRAIADGEYFEVAKKPALRGPWTEDARRAIAETVAAMPSVDKA